MTGEHNAIAQESFDGREVVALQGNRAEYDPRQPQRRDARAVRQLQGGLTGSLGQVQASLFDLHLRRSAQRMDSQEDHAC